MDGLTLVSTDVIVSSLYITWSGFWIVGVQMGCEYSTIQVDNQIKENGT